MGNPYMNRDESIILTTHRIRINSTMADVLLTNQRLIIVDPGYAQFRPQTILLTTIETVMSGEDAQNNPILSLSLSALTPQGATQSKELIFIQKVSGERKQERDDWLKQLKEHIAIVRQQAPLNLNPPPNQETGSIVSGEIKPDRIARFPIESPLVGKSYSMQQPVMTPGLADSADDTTGEPVSPENVTPAAPEPGESLAEAAGEATQNSIPLSSRFHPPAAASDRSKSLAVTGIIIVMLALVGGWIIYSGTLQGNPGAPSVPVITPVIPPETTLVPTPTLQQTATPQVTVVSPSQPQIIIPSTGVWVRVIYSGNFTGTVGTTGKMRLVTGSVDQFYQVPTIDGIVEALIQKLDGSGNVLTTEVYKNGTMVKNGTITAPRGTIDLRVDLKRV
jgi:hypothetical protein